MLHSADADRIGLRTDGVVIIKNGKLIYEKYARGFTKDNRTYLVSHQKRSVFGGHRGGYGSSV